MDGNLDRISQRLISTLDDLLRGYRALLEMVRRERQALVESDVNQLNDINEDKEAIIVRLRALENQRQRYLREAMLELALETESPRLMEVATHFPFEAAERLRNVHSALNLLLKRLAQLNQENEQIAAAALKNVSQVLKEIKRSTQPPQTYQNKGQVVTPLESTGQKVQKEV